MQLTAGCFQSDEAMLNKDIKKELEFLTSITLGIEEIIPDGQSCLYDNITTTGWTASDQARQCY